MFYPVVASVTIFLLYTFVKLASTSPQSLCPSLGHANTVRIFSACRRPCWRLVPRKAFVLRRATPTRPEFSRFPGAFVGALFPAKPLSFVGARQHGPVFPGPSVPLLAPCSPQSLCPSQSHANMARILPACRRPCCYNFREKRRSKKVVPRPTFLLLHLLWSG